MPFNRSPRRFARHLMVVLWAVGALVVGLAGPATAQYGGTGIDFFVDPRVEIDETFSVFGNGCAPGSIVEITIDGVDGVLATTTASASGNYSVSDIPLPDGLSAGSDYTVRATCGTETATALMTLLCHDGQLPVGGDCEDGSDGLVGGAGPTTTTTTVPGDGGGEPSGGGSNPDGSGDGGDSSPDLAFTGASFSQILVQTGVTLFAAGFVLILVARRRRTATI